MQQKNIPIDSLLLIGLKNGNSNCFKKIFEIYSPSLYQFSLSYLKSKEDAEGVVQEVFIVIWNKRKEIKKDTSFQSYLFTIAINLIRKYFNQQSRLNEIKYDILVEFSQCRSCIDDKEDYQILLNTLDFFIRQMPDKRRQVFVKKKLEEKSIKQIAKELSITPKTVEYHITEAMKYLRYEFRRLQSKGISSPKLVD